MTRPIIGIHQKPPFPESLMLSFQHLTAMFGGTVLAPILMGVDPAIALLMNGIGTFLHRSLLGDGISNVISGFTGSVPNTTYGENIGVMAITRVYSVWVIRGAAILAILFSCIGKVSAAISTIPVPVMGGITMLLFGVIAVQGLRMFVEQKVDFSLNRNMVLGAITFTAGVSGACINIALVKLSGMALAATVGIIFSLIFWIIDRLKLISRE